MADPTGFITQAREVAGRRPVDERLGDWNEVYPDTPGAAVLPIIVKQASRCMDCGIPFCHQGCPLGNLIPEWNDLVWRDDWRGATDRLMARLRLSQPWPWRYWQRPQRWWLQCRQLLQWSMLPWRLSRPLLLRYPLRRQHQPQLCRPQTSRHQRLPPSWQRR